jgi:O-antigen/teichoic acid export membrane protein
LKFFFKNFNFFSLTNYLEYIKSGTERSKKLKKNIILLLVFQIASILLNFLLVPLSLNYLGTYKYGVWLTIFSFITWFNFLDIGVGNGLRNKLVEANAQNNIPLARKYVSTSYFILGIIILIVFTALIIQYFFVDWKILLNAQDIDSVEINLLILIVFSFFLLKIFFGMIGSILLANQTPASNSFLNLITVLVYVVIVFFLQFSDASSLLLFGTTLSFSGFLIMFIGSIYYFSSRYKNIRPSFKFVDLSYAKSISNLSFKFFLIQISSVIIFSSSNIIIIQLLGPGEVTNYNIVYKYFSVVLILFSIILTPFWSAVTDAYVKNELEWVKNLISKFKQLWLVSSVVVIIMIALSSFVYSIWIGEDFEVPQMLNILMGLFVILICWSYIFTNFINGVGKLKIQLYTSIFGIIANIPLAIIFIKYFNLGLSGIVLAIIISQLPGTIFMYIQYKKIISYQAKKIWIK